MNNMRNKTDDDVKNVFSGTIISICLNPGVKTGVTGVTGSLVGGGRGWGVFMHSP